MNIQETIESSITQREDEVAGYQFNITNFEMMLARLPQGDVPPDEADELVLSQYRLRDDIRQRIVAERVQMQTAQLVLDVLLARRDKG